MTARSPEVDYEHLRAGLASFGQEHVLQWWAELSPAQQESLAHQLRAIDLGQLAELFADAEKPSAGRIGNPSYREPPVLRLPTSFEDWEHAERMAERGEEALKTGQVAVVLVAGGQGTRLGYDGPKGTYPIGPVSGKSLFQIHAEKVLALSRRYEVPLPLYIMTSPDNDAPTQQYFQEHGHFGLEFGQVVFFMQGTMPAISRSGKLLMADKGELATSPNGHGGVLLALAQGGHLADLSRRGVRYIFYYQVDNPLAKVADPAYLGHHIESGAEMSLKVVSKLNPAEKLGVVVTPPLSPPLEGGDAGGLQIIEYSDLPRELAERRKPDGSLELWAGSIAIHIFNVGFLERMAASSSMLPYHRALKKAPYLDENGQLMEPAEPNALKFEMFVFDALPLARKALVVETSRWEEFEPLKNAEGENSPATVRQAMTNLFAEWLKQAGVSVARRPDGSLTPVEISPLFALDAAELRAKLDRTEPVTEPLLLESTPTLPSPESGEGWDTPTLPSPESGEGWDTPTLPSPESGEGWEGVER